MTQKADEEEILVDGLGALLGKTGGRSTVSASGEGSQCPAHPPTRGTDTAPHKLSKVGQDSTSTALLVSVKSKASLKTGIGLSYQ